MLACVACGIAAFGRPAWAVFLYMLTFFMSPGYWWWGGPVASYRWNLYAGIALLLSALIHGRFQLLHNPRIKWFAGVAGILAANAVVVHFLLAPNTEVSLPRLVLHCKLALLFVLITISIKNKKDLTVVLFAILIGASYLGYEVTVNKRGRLMGNRLEGVGVPNASSANDLACLMVTTIPVVAPFMLVGKFHHKIMSFAAGSLILNVILKCNSRGAFLALIGGAFIFMCSAPRMLRLEGRQSTLSWPHCTLVSAG